MRNKRVLWPSRRVRWSLRDLRVTRAKLLGSHGRWSFEVECNFRLGDDKRAIPTFDRWHDWLKAGGWDHSQISDEQIEAWVKGRRD